MSGKQRLTTVFVVLYLVAQITAPALGIQARSNGVDAFPFSWHMFSTIPVDAEQ